MTVYKNHIINENFEVNFTPYDWSEIEIIKYSSLEEAKSGIDEKIKNTF